MNPVAWAMGVEAYLESLRLVPACAGSFNPEDGPGSVTEAQLAELWRQGIIAREAVIVSTGPDNLQTVAKAYRTAAKNLLVSFLAPFSAKLNDNNTYPFQQPFKLTKDDHRKTNGTADHPSQYVVGSRPNCPYSGIGAYTCKTNGSKQAYSIDKDPLDFASQHGLAHKGESTVVGPHSSGTFHGNAYPIMIDVGDAQGPLTVRDDYVSLKSPCAL